MAVGEEPAVPGDDEQRVVDPDPEPDHDPERRSNVRDVHHVAQQADHAQTGEHREQRRHDRERHRGGGPERDQEDDDRRDDPDHLACPGVGLGHLLAEIAADGDRQPRTLGRALGGVDDLVRLVDVDFVAPDRQQH
jgi:hypothetical protein